MYREPIKPLDPRPSRYGVDQTSNKPVCRVARDDVSHAE